MKKESTVMKIKKRRNVQTIVWMVSVLLFMAGVFALSSYAEEGEIRSSANVTIPARQEFVLGEYESDSFQAKLENTSEYSCQAHVVTKKNDSIVQTMELKPAQKVKLAIKKSEKVILKNENTEAIVIRAVLSSSVQGMRYQEIDSFKK